MTFGQAPTFIDPTRYSGESLFTLPAVNNPRAPTTADRNYPLFTIWRNSNRNAVAPDNEGDMWLLVRFTAPVPPLTLTNAIWQKITTGSVPGGTVISISDTAGTAVFPDAAGDIQLVGGAGINIVSTPATNLLTVSLAGGGVAIDQINVDANTAPGTDPVLPDGAGQISITGAQVANGVVGANVIRTDSLAANAFTIEVQRSAAVAATDSTINGVSHYNSAQFAVDANGFVSLTGGGMAIDSFTTDVAGPVTPDGAGNVAFTGSTSTYSNGTVANTLRTEVQGTNHGVFVGQGALTPATTIAVGATGEVLAGLTGADPDFTNSISDGALPTFTFTSATASVDRQVTISNTDNTIAATSEATLEVLVGGANVGDPKTQYVVSGVQTWTQGIDNSASDTYTIAASAALGTTDTARCTIAGEWTYPLQPAFLAYVAVDIPNVTGDATIYTVICDTEVYDQAADFNLATSTFTAPITGKYHFDGAVLIEGGTQIDLARVGVNTSNNFFKTTMPRTPGSITGADNGIVILADMDAADTAVLTVEAVDTGGKIDDVTGLQAGAIRSFISGKLEC